MRQPARTPIVFLASGAWVGFLPLMPGTFGTLLGIPVSLGVNRLAAANLLLGACALIAITVGAMIVADQAARLLRTRDPQVIVIDEIAGFTLANFLTESTGAIVIAFLLFRLFDIAKVFPGRRLEALPGGAGIVLDDMLAGLYAMVVLRALFWTGLL